MGKQSNKRQALELQAQSQAVALAALTVSDTRVQDQIFSAANTLDRLARSEARKSEAAKAEPVQQLPADASAQELRTARQRRAVRRGDDVYLPSWTEATIGLPNALLRSAMFSAASTSPGYLREAKLASQGDSTLTFTGEGLTSYDRKIFAVCLDHYREDRPLSPGGDALWVRTTYFAFARDMGLQYGANVHRAIRASLLRLNSANLRVRVNRLNVPLPRLIEVAFDEGYMDETTPDDQLKGSDAIVFRISEAMASLFGPTDWTAVPKVALNDITGLSAWLASFYATHSKPYTLQVNDLYELSAVASTKAEFRRMLRIALAKLQEFENGAIRVDRYAVTRNDVWVCLARWNHKAPCPLKIDEDI